jgi:polyisoprenoid-binding protein YceI
MTDTPSLSSSPGRVQPEPGLWTIDATHSFVTFRVLHFTIAFARGMAAGPTGAITIAPNFLESTVTASIDASTVTTLNAVRDAKVRGPDVLDVERYGSIDFFSTGLTRQDRDQYRVVGSLTLHGVTSEITLEVAFNGVVVDTWGKRRLGVTAQAVLNRDDFGSGEWGRVALPGGGFMVPNLVELTLDIEATNDADHDDAS